MRLGVVIEDTWNFFYEVFEELQKNHQTSLFKRRCVNLPFFETRINQALYYRDLQTFFNRNDVVFFEWSSEMLVHATQLPKSCGIVTRLHRYEMYEWVDKINWDIVDKIILVSQAKKREFIRRFPEQEEKLVVIPEAVSLGKFQSKKKPFNGDIGILCDLMPRKRVYELILAFYELNRLKSGFTLHIGGGKRPRFYDYYEALQHLVSELRLNDKVIFYGHVSDPHQWYQNVDVFISNSYSEGLQVSPLEAIASGCNCFSHAWDGAAELIPKENLYYSERELIELLLKYSDSLADQQQYEIERLQNIVRERFDVDKTKIQIRQIIEEVGANGTGYK